MAKAYLSLIKAALAEGFTIKVWVDEEACTSEDNYVGTEYNKIKEAVESCDGGADFSIFDGKTRIAYVILAIGYGNEDEETVADWSYKPLSKGETFMDEWFNKFTEEHPY
jgi:hypothetical protein